MPAQLPFIIGAVVLVLLLGFGIFWCTSRVKVTVNGSELTVGRGTSVQKVVEQSPAEKTPGDFVTVSGNVIEAGKGEAFTATVNGNQMSAQQAADVQIEGGESIEVSRGADITEEYDAEPMQTMPKLVIDGDSYIMGYLYQWGRPGVTEKRTGKVSGEIASVVTQEVQDCIVRERRPQPANDEKIVALTFDDGPSKYTQQFLDILDKYEVKATFFNLGENIDQYPELAKKVVEKGHQLASHTYNHKQLNKLDAAEFIKQVDENAKRIEEVTGVYTSFIRAPYGEFSSECWLNSKGSITAAVNWTEDSEDWALPGVDAIVEKAAGDVNPGSIILMHDGGGEREQGIQALPQIIEKLQAKGYRFVTLDELFASDPEIPNDVCNSKVKMPDWAVWPTELAKTTPTTSAANGTNASSSGNANAGTSNANASGTSSASSNGSAGATNANSATGSSSSNGTASGNTTTGGATSTSGSSTAKTGAATSSQQQSTTQKSGS
jgi:peptidoglycan/xylan/chitin deacetylase (PgdA/CDA1 family)